MSAFRPLRPSSNTASPPDAGSGPADSGRSSPPDQNSSGSGKNRKRRAPSHVSQNACTNCKKARAKCDGEEPAPCTRCVSRSITDSCHYEVHVKTVKEEMVRRIRSLEQQNAELQDSVKEKEQWIKDIFQMLTEDKQGVEALQKLRQGQSNEQLVEWLDRPPFHNVGRLSPGSERRLSEIVKKYEDSMSASPASALMDDRSPAWTRVTSNERLCHHLMALYFTWIHPVHMVFSEKHFISSFRSGDRTYCTPSMVNAICALGCLYLVDEAGSEIDPKNLGIRFLEQATVDIATEDRKRLTCGTTYAILFLVELSLGQARKASSHLRLAVELLSKMDKSGYAKEALALTSWGIYTLSTAWAGLTYQNPTVPIHFGTTIFQNVQMDQEDAYWQPYRFPADAASSEIPSYAIATALELAKLGQIERETIKVYCGTQGKVVAKAILDLYQKYLQWHENLPPELTFAHDGGQTRAHVFFLHAQYHVAVCQLFQPLLDYSHFDPKTRSHIESITLQSARRGGDILRQYRNLYTNRYQTPLQAFCIVHICDILLREQQPESSREDVILFCLGMLCEALPGFPFVGALQAMFCQSVIDRGLVLPERVKDFMSDRSQYGPEDLLDTCERTTYAQPTDMLLDRLDQSIAVEFERDWQAFIETHGGGETMAVDDVDGPQQLQLPSSMSSPGSRSMNIHSMINH